MATAPYDLDQATETQLKHWRVCNDRDTDRVLDVGHRLGAVTVEGATVTLTKRGKLSMRRRLGEPGETG